MFNERLDWRFLVVVGVVSLFLWHRGYFQFTPQKSQDSWVSPRIEGQRSPAAAVKMVDPAKAARRAVGLKALYMRAHFEEVISIGKKFSAKQDAMVRDVHRKFSDELNQWLKKEGFWNCLSGREQELLAKPFGTWSEQEKINGIWRAESLGVILWALKVEPSLPAYDQSIERAPSLPSPPPLMKGTGDFIRSAQLRSSEEIGKRRDVAELWLWRSRTRLFSREAGKYPPPRGMTYEEIIRKSAECAEREGVFKAVEGDFPAFGKPYSKLTEEEWYTMQSIAYERLYVLNWLCGYEEDWDKVETGT